VSNSLSIISERSLGFKKAIADFNLSEDDCRIVYCNDDSCNNYEVILQLLRQNDRPDGIVATVEKLTLNIYMACKQLNINIPQQLKVICFSNQSSAVILNPSLTTITQPAFEMGKAAAISLLRALKNHELKLADESSVIPSILTVRESTMMF